MSTERAIEYEPDPALSFWPTPSAVAEDLVYQALEPWHVQGDGEGVRVLEPSAGDGHLGAEIRRQLPRAHIVCVEPSPQRAAHLRAREGVADEVHEATIEDYAAGVAVRALSGDWQPFDLVVMNPPFTLAGHPEAWAEHVLLLHDDPNLLAPDGVVSAVVPRIVMTGRSRLVRAVRGLLHPHYGITECERGAFAPASAQISTALILIERETTTDHDRD